MRESQKKAYKAFIERNPNYHKDKQREYARKRRERLKLLEAENKELKKKIQEK